MSSAAASFSQVPVRGKYYINGYVYQEDQLAEEDLLSWAEDNNVEMVGSTLKFDTLAQFENAWSPQFDVIVNDYNTLVKDMGKSYYISVGGTILLEYRLVQRVRSGNDSNNNYPESTEGVPGDYANAGSKSNYGKFLICVFAANSSQDASGFDYVQFARTG